MTSANTTPDHKTTFPPETRAFSKVDASDSQTKGGCQRTRRMAKQRATNNPSRGGVSHTTYQGERVGDGAIVVVMRRGSLFGKSADGTAGGGTAVTVSVLVLTGWAMNEEGGALGAGTDNSSIHDEVARGSPMTGKKRTSKEMLNSLCLTHQETLAFIQSMELSLAWRTAGAESLPQNSMRWMLAQ